MSEFVPVPKKLEQRISVLSDKLMPKSGPAETLEGELLRALNKILYRYYNDGDYWWKGYGCETAGPAASFLIAQKAVNVKASMDASDHADSPKYEKALFTVARKIVAHIEKQETYQKNVFDMLDFTSKYTYQDEDDEDDLE